MGTETTGFVYVKGLEERIKEAERFDAFIRRCDRLLEGFKDLTAKYKSVRRQIKKRRQRK